MRRSILSLITLSLLVSGVGIKADIYQTRDADGSTVFTDVPSAEAQKINLQKTNTADSVKVRPPEQKQKQSEAISGGQGSWEDLGPTVIGSNDDAIDDLAARRRRHELSSRVPDDRKPDIELGRERPAQLPVRPHPRRGRR